MEDGRWDLLEWLGPDASACVMNYLNNPADLARAAAVSKSWSHFVISNEFGKRLCMKLCPEISNFSDIELVDNYSSKPLEEASSSTSAEWQILRRAHLVFTYFAHRLLAHKSEKASVLTCVGASSTDNFPEESIQNTLEPSERVDLRPSYWSSGGQRDPNVPESLVYRLESDLYIVTEIKIQPFKAFFQYEHPIYSAKRVRFRLGHPKIDLSDIDPFTEEEESQLTKDSNYVWTYTSPEYEMSQDNNLQVFKLPRPILCIGGVLKMELLGRVQTQEIDGLYYICICHVQVIGRTVSPSLDVATSGDRTILRYCPQSAVTSATDKSSEGISVNEEARPRWWSFTSRFRRLGPNALLNTILGGVPVQFLDMEEDENDDEEDGIGDDGDDGDYDVDMLDAPEEEPDA